jgi:hypothetical protein
MSVTVGGVADEAGVRAAGRTLDAQAAPIGERDLVNR